MLSTISFRKDVMAKSAMNGFTNATDAADYLVNKGVPFRDAHGIIGRMVLLCIDKNCAIEDLSMDEFKELCPAFEEDIYDAISLETCVAERKAYGGPSEESVRHQIALMRDFIEKH
jgi:argininosuccinate lyase